MAFTLWNFKVYNNKPDVLSLRQYGLSPLSAANTEFQGKVDSPAVVPLNARMAFKPVNFAVIHRASFIFHEQDQFMHHSDRASILRVVCCALKLICEPERPEFKAQGGMVCEITHY